MLDLKSQESVMELVYKIYNGVVDGTIFPKEIKNMDTIFKTDLFSNIDSKTIAEQLILKHSNPKEASKNFINQQLTLSAISGFIANACGFSTMLFTLPTNIISVLYIQIKAITVLSAIAGFDPKDDSTRTLALSCFLTEPLVNICKQTGVNFTNKITLVALKKMPAKVLIKINQKVGFRFITKFGEKGIINLFKMIPIAGGIFGGSIDYISTSLVVNKAYKLFIENKIKN